MNTVILIGNLTKAPELRFTQTGKAVATFTVAVSRGFGKDDQADFIPCVAWEKTGENCANHLDKGSKVGIQGRMQTRSYETNEGSQRYITEVIANTVEFLGGKPPARQDQESSSAPEDFTEMPDYTDDDLPF